jgi:hypothetical protein
MLINLYMQHFIEKFTWKLILFSPFVVIVMMFQGFTNKIKKLLDK